MECQPQNPEFRNNSENFHPCVHLYSHQDLSLFGFTLLTLLPLSTRNGQTLMSLGHFE